MKHSFNIIQELIKIVAFFLLGCLIPNKGKRIIVLASLYAKLVEKGIFHKEALERINNALMIADSEEAMNLPPYVYRKVIDEGQLEEAIKELETTSEGNIRLTYREAKRISSQIVDLTPIWLRYSDNKTMEKDIVNLFQFHCQ